MDVSRTKEDLSICYLKIITAINGIALEQNYHDEDSIDVVIKKFVELESTNLISNALPVLSEAPADVMLIFVEPVATPRPICFALVPPVVSVAPDAACVVWYIISLKVTDEDLNATVLTLAILLPITSIFVW